MIIITPTISIAESELEFHYIRSPGPGGQNVNRVATAVQLRFDAAGSPSLPDTVKRRLRGVSGRRMLASGEIVIRAQRFRSQDANRADAVDRLVRLLRRAADPAKTRRPTSIPRAATERRLESKHRRATTKELRRPPLDD